MASSAPGLSRVTILLLVALAALAAAPCTGVAGEGADILGLDLEALLDLEVVSVSKRTQSVRDAAAAVFVITAEDVRRAGVTTIPDALRLAPGLDVQSIDSNKWAVSARGFNGRFGNKLLVMVDGRSIYNSLFAGVYWEHLDMLMEDLDRIEVIRGPGAVMWGANAVNGVINVITRHAADTQGTLATAAAGTHELFAGALRHGWRFGDGGYARTYVKTSHRGSFTHEGGGDAGDEWRIHSAGFRLDMEPGTRDAVTFQGDLHLGTAGQILAGSTPQPPFRILNDEDVPLHGGSVGGSWRRSLAGGSAVSLEAYYQRLTRQEYIGKLVSEVVDLEFRHDRRLGRHHVSLGTGVRRTRANLEDSPMATTPFAYRTDDLSNISVQDDIDLADGRLNVVLGAKYEHNNYTHNEMQPGVRMIWSPWERQRIWAAASRAVRTPSRYEAERGVIALVIPPFSPVNPLAVPVVLMTGDSRGFDAENLQAYEMGYRFAADAYQLDITAFYNDYANVRVAAISDPVVFADRAEQYLTFRNGEGGRTYGAEVAATWMPDARLRFDLAYTYLDEKDVYDLENLVSWYAFTPRHHVSLRAALDLPRGWDLDGWLRTRGSAAFSTMESAGRPVTVQGTTTLDVRLGKRWGGGARLELVGQDLLAGEHLEFLQEAFMLPTLIHAGWYLKATVEF